MQLQLSRYPLYRDTQKKVLHKGSLLFWPLLQASSGEQQQTMAPPEFMLAEDSSCDGHDMLKWAMESDAGRLGQTAEATSLLRP
jgi:hypothetical protein